MRVCVLCLTLAKVHRSVAAYVYGIQQADIQILPCAAYHCMMLSKQVSARVWFPIHIFLYTLLNFVIHLLKKC